MDPTYMLFCQLAEIAGMNMISEGLGSILLMVVAFKYISSEEGVSAIVNRRLSGDSYRYLNSGNLTNLLICRDDGNFTFIVSERRCVKNQELINGIFFHCSVAGSFATSLRLKNVIITY